MNLNWSRPAGRLSPVPQLEPLDLPPLWSMDNCGGIFLGLATLAFGWWQRNWGLATMALGMVLLICQREYWRRRPLLPAVPADPTEEIPARGAARHSYQYTVRNVWELPLWLVLFIHVCLLNLMDIRESSTPMALMGALLLVAALYPLRQSRVRHWWRYGYDAATDCFFRQRAAYLGPFRTLARLPAGDFCGIYWERREELPLENPSYFTTQLWLAGRAGREDVLLGEFTYWHRDNQQLAQRLTVALAAASGLPQLYRLAEIGEEMAE